MTRVGVAQNVSGNWVAHTAPYAAAAAGSFAAGGVSALLTTLGGVDANAVRAADRNVLVGLAAAVAGNAGDLLADAEVLLGAGRWARAYSLALLAAEEWAKAYTMITLSFMPAAVRARIPVREFLEGHRLKMMGALMLPFSARHSRE